MIYNTGLEAIISGLSAVLLAQLAKLFTFYFKNKEINFEYLSTTGGMPSSHSAGVCALTTSVGLIAGFDSIMFAVSAGYALVVMHDAAGVRKKTQDMAKLLNKIIKDFYKSDLKTKSAQLKELLGHTPIEVFVGLLLGVLVSLVMHIIFAPN